LVAARKEGIGAAWRRGLGWALRRQAVL